MKGLDTVHLFLDFFIYFAEHLTDWFVDIRTYLPALVAILRKLTDFFFLVSVTCRESYVTNFEFWGNHREGGTIENREEACVIVYRILFCVYFPSSDPISCKLRHLLVVQIAYIEKQSHFIIKVISTLKFLRRKSSWPLFSFLRKFYQGCWKGSFTSSFFYSKVIPLTVKLDEAAGDGQLVLGDAVVVADVRPVDVEDMDAHDGLWAREEAQEIRTCLGNRKQSFFVSCVLGMLVTGRTGAWTSESGLELPERMIQVFFVL